MTAVRWRWLIGAGAVLAAVIAAGCLWYARPMTLEELIPGFSLEYCHMITLDATEMRFSGHEMEEACVELTPEDPEFDQLLALLEGRTYRRSPLRRLLEWNGYRTQDWEVGDFCWTMTLSRGELWEPYARFRNYLGKLRITSINDQRLLASTTEQEEWMREILKIAQRANERRDREAEEEAHQRWDRAVG